MTELKEISCKNCNQPMINNFCDSCGQKEYKRIDRKYILDEIQYTVLHTNKGFLYSAKSILKNAGNTAREYIEGKRVNHYKPISLVFVLGTISAFLSYKVIGFTEIMQNYYANQKQNLTFMNDLMTAMTSYSAVIMVLFLPVIAVVSKLLFKKWGQNYYEHIIMHAYGMSFYNIISILFLYPLFFAFRGNATVFMTMTNVSSFLIIPLTMIWFFKNFYPDRSLKSIIGRVFLMVMIILFLYMILIIGLMIYSVIVHGIGILKPQ
jgi:hypothetical protein